MKINIDYEDAKSEYKQMLPATFFIFGLVILLISIILFATKTSDYCDEFKQKNWTVTNATITSIGTHKDSTFSLDGSSSDTIIYDISYEYKVKEISYKGEYGALKTNEIGNVIQIKYNPLSPNQSTNILEPNPYPLIFAASLVVIGILLITISFASDNKRKNKNIDKHYVIRLILKITLPILVIIGVLMIIFSFVNLANGVKMNTQILNELNWKTKTATVLSSEINENNTYTILYEYNVGETKYVGEYFSIMPENEGTNIKIKHKPDYPAISTTKSDFDFIDNSLLLNLGGLIIIFISKFGLKKLKQEKESTV